MRSDLLLALVLCVATSELVEVIVNDDNSGLPSERDGIESKYVVGLVSKDAHKPTPTEKTRIVQMTSSSGTQYQCYIPVCICCPVKCRHTVFLLRMRATTR